MEAWIAITLLAAAAQTGRFMVQKRLRAGTLSTAAATWARFLYAAPLAVIVVAGYALATGQGLPRPAPAFWPFALGGALAQVLATACVVALFTFRNFAVGLTLKKSEVMMTAAAGFVILGDRVSGPALAAMAAGLAGVLLVSAPPRVAAGAAAGVAAGASAGASAGSAAGAGAGSGEGDAGGRAPAGRALLLGLLSGLFFALSATGYRGAVLALDGGDVALRAGAALVVVTAAQTLGLGLWIAVREPGQIGATLRAWRVAGLAGALSMLGSLGWFAAFALQGAALVFALGQVELIFAALAATLVFGERITRREAAGMLVLGGSILALVLVT